MFASRIFPRFGSRLQADPVYILEMFVMRLTGRPGVFLNNIVDYVKKVPKSTDSLPIVLP
jgi:hypothetical protein